MAATTGDRKLAHQARNPANLLGSQRCAANPGNAPRSATRRRPAQPRQ
jgi:hypothetical protein